MRVVICCPLKTSIQTAHLSISAESLASRYARSAKTQSRQLHENAKKTRASIISHSVTDTRYVVWIEFIRVIPEENKTNKKTKIRPEIRN